MRVLIGIIAAVCGMGMAIAILIYGYVPPLWVQGLPWVLLAWDALLYAIMQELKRERRQMERLKKKAEENLLRQQLHLML